MVLGLEEAGWELGGIANDSEATLAKTERSLKSAKARSKRYQSLASRHKVSLERSRDTAAREAKKTLASAKREVERLSSFVGGLRANVADVRAANKRLRAKIQELQYVPKACGTCGVEIRYQDLPRFDGLCDVCRFKACSLADPNPSIVQVPMSIYG